MLLGIGLLCSLLFAPASFASNLKDVRVGPHGDYTRVVLETDVKASYSLNQSDGVVTIELQASAAPKAVTAKSQQLSWVRVEPAGASSIVRIELKGPARVKQMVLTAPHRIVLDVFGDASAAAASPPPREPVAKAKPTPAPAPAPPASEPARAPIAAADEEVQREAEAMLGPPPGATPSAPPSGDVATTDGAGAADSATSDEAAALEGASGDPEQAAAPPAVPEPKPAPIRVVEHEKEWIDWLFEWPVLAGLAVMMLGLFVILRRKPAQAAPKPKAREEEASAASLFASEPSASSATPESVSHAASEPTTSDAGDSAFELEPPDTEPEKPDLGPAHGAMLSTIASVTSTSAFETQAPTSTGGLSLPELDRRLALLEQRLEEVIDAKDRLERQVSAQTEELRVQRAAIARTQRVLRTVVRPEDDQPSEPVLKS